MSSDDQKKAPLPQPDAETSFFEFLAWIEVHKKQILTGAVVVSVVIIGAMVFRWMRSQKELQANEALLQLRAPINAPSNYVPAQASAYMKVADQFGSTDAAERALILAAGALFDEGKYAEAQAQFSKFLQEHPGSPLAATAAYGVASAQEAQGKRDEALASYQTFVTTHANSHLADEARMAMARIYDAKNQPELALKTYNELTKPGVESLRATEARVLKEELLKKHPNLAPPTPTNAPTAGMSMPVPLTITPGATGQVSPNATLNAPANPAPPAPAAPNSPPAATPEDATKK